MSNSSSSDKVFPNCLSGLDLFPNDKLRVVRPSPAKVLFAFVSAGVLWLQCGYYVVVVVVVVVVMEASARTRVLQDLGSVRRE